MTNCTDSNWHAVLDRVRAGDNLALGQLLDRYRSYITLLVRLQLDHRLRIKVSESDIVQHSFFEAVRDFREFRGNSEAELAGWMRSIVARNLADTIRQYCQTQQRDIQLELSLEQELEESSAAFECAFVSPVSSPSQQASERERAVVLSDALAELPKPYREVVIRRHFEGKSFPEIAKEMGRSLDGVKNIWFRAFDQLRKVLKATP